MTDNLLTICMSNHNTSKFALNNLYCLKKTTKNSYKVIIRDNDSNEKDFLNLKKGIKDFSNVELYRLENLGFAEHQASLAVGYSLNDLVQRIDTDYGVIIDTDYYFLYKDWDEILLNMMNEKTPIAGTQAPIGKESDKPLDFPFVFGVIFNTKIVHDLEIDFRPTLHLNNQDEGFKDVSYQLREKFLEKGFQSILIKYKNTRFYKKGPFRNLIGIGEYYLNGYGKIFGSHFGRGSTLGRAKYNKGWKSFFYRLPLIGSFMLNFKGNKQIRKWIKICKRIVDDI